MPVLTITRPWLEQMLLLAQTQSIDPTHELMQLRASIAQLKANDFSAVFSHTSPNSSAVSQASTQVSLEASAPTHRNRLPKSHLQPNQTLLKKFLKEKALQGLRHSSIEQLALRINFFLNAINSPVQNLSRQQALAFEQQLYKMPRSSKTQKDYLSSAKQFCNWLVKQGLLQTNFMTLLSIKVVNKSRARDERQRWQPEQLRQLFNHSAYLACTNHQLSQREAQNYWIPLLLIFTGARLNEICQLHLRDIAQEQGIWCIDIHDRDVDRQLKNENAIRKIPMHSALIEAGFLQYLSSRKSHQRLKLFDLTATKQDNNWGKAFGQRFGKLLTRCGFTQKDRPTLHSFRHTFIDEMQQANVDEHVTSELVGHAKSGITYGRYGKQIELRQLKATVELLPNFLALCKEV